MSVIEPPITGETEDAQALAGHPTKRRLLLRNAGTLVCTSALTSGLGFVYWVLAARLFLPSDLGEASTAIAAMSLIAPFTILGFGTLLIAELPGTRMNRTSLVTTTVAISAVVGSAVALLATQILPTSFLGLPGIGHQVAITALFVAGTAAQGVGFMLDQALLSLVGGGMQLLRNAVGSVGKLALLALLALVPLVLGHTGSVVIVFSWFAANVLSIAVVGIILIRRHRVPVRRMRPSLSVLRGLHVDAAHHHALNMALFLPFFAMPIVANVILGSEQAGYLYATWSIAGFIFHLPIALAMALFASGVRDSRTFLMEFRFTLRGALLVCAAANLAMLVLGGPVLRIFGGEYALNGRTALVIMCLGGLGLVIKDHHVVLARVAGRIGPEAVLISILGVAEIAGATWGASHGGLTGLSLGWVAAVILEVAVCGPLVWRTYRGGTDPAS